MHGADRQQLLLVLLPALSRQWPMVAETPESHRKCLILVVEG
jgi:hypothetical protein